MILDEDYKSVNRSFGMRKNVSALCLYATIYDWNNILFIVENNDV